jgi:tetratricopeptide (TPR) repeat protein
MFKKVFFVFGFLFTFAKYDFLFSQQKTPIDSLEIALQKEKKSDEVKVKKLLAMSQTITNSHTDRALLYAQQALLISEKNDYKNRKGEILIQIAKTYFKQGQYNKALEYYLRASQIFKVT